MHPLLNHASFAYITNFGLRFTLAGWYQAAKSAKLNRQRKFVDFNTVIGFSGLFVVIHVQVQWWPKVLTHPMESSVQLSLAPKHAVFDFFEAKAD